jgi:hypothetical protein
VTGQADAPREHDAMLCRHCGKEERASEGYPCIGCGTFICLICTMRGHRHCTACEQLGAPTGAETRE